MLKLDNIMNNKSHYILLFPLIFIVLLEIIAILFLNNGFFTYTLDDAYIHLSVAENIYKGHYGINFTEFSAPSSSIIWPLIIAPFSKLSFFYFVPLIVNIIITLIMLLLCISFIDKSFFYDKTVSNLWLFFLITIFLIITNFVGLIFLGMEHSLQIFFVLIIAFGLINKIELNKTPFYLYFAIIFAPLIRYENLSISLSAILFLILINQKKSALIVSMVMIFLLLVFSYFLYLNTGTFLPTSVLLKSSYFNESNLFFPLKNFLKSLKINEGLRLTISLFILLIYVFFSKEPTIKIKLALVTIFAIILHLFFGQYGWFQRYELYIWNFTLVILLYLFKEKIRNLLVNVSWRNALIILLGSFLFFHHYYYALLATPFASNNIYEQHYMMHKFVKDFYQNNVGVHDIGYVSFNNPYYVLDINGLSSIDVYKYRKSRTNSKEWLKNLSQKYNVKLFIIYDSIIEIPDQWIKVASLCLSRQNIIAFDNCVSFYISDSSQMDSIRDLLGEFKKILPGGVKLILK